mmetsp:Transcript_21132/g.23529  ORF Transcript_21132/g.23529 Transcript_21132/m.23529 type:complete len:129 (+) Transcript_21132:40-426(+)
MIGNVVKLKTKSDETIMGIVYGYYKASNSLFLKPNLQIENIKSDDFEYFKQEDIQSDFIIVNVKNVISICKVGVHKSPIEIIEELKIQRIGDTEGNKEETEQDFQEKIDETNKIWTEKIAEYMPHSEQ